MLYVGFFDAEPARGVGGGGPAGAAGVSTDEEIGGLAEATGPPTSSSRDSFLAPDAGRPITGFVIFGSFGSIGVADASCCSVVPWLLVVSPGFLVPDAGLAPGEAVELLAAPSSCFRLADPNLEPVPSEIAF